MKESHRRGARTQKAYLICMAVKTVHLEIVTDLSTEFFLAALDRFTSRYGIKANIYSDCGTNYVGAAKEIKALLERAILGFSASGILTHRQRPTLVTYMRP